MTLCDDASRDAATYEPIGVIHTPFSSATDAPRQPEYGKGVPGTVVLRPEFQGGLKGIERFTHIVLVFHLHESEGYSLEVCPPGQAELRGVFASRAPRRPNPIGISVVRLMKVEGGTLHVEDLDILDGTPLLDIKPHIAGGA
jgi:tRNA-Thr(GGU) m(6)t(6)A37 methyltransferase TsaA